MTNPNKYQESDEWITAAISDVTVFINEDGTDSDTARYLNMGEGNSGHSTSLQLRTDKVITIEAINDQTLKAPMTINANSSWTQSRRSRLRIRSFKINVLTTSTSLKLFVNTTGRRGD